MAAKRKRSDAKRQKSDLQVALESFSRCSMDLTAEKLESTRGVLEALFEDDATVSSNQRHQRAEEVCQAILRFVEGCKVTTDRLTGKVAFAIGEDLRNHNVGERVNLAHLVNRTYYDHRDLLMRRLVRELRTEFGSPEPAEPGVLLSPKVQAAARQAFRHAQGALICLDAYGACVLYASIVHDGFRRVASPDPKGRPPGMHAWLQPFSYRDHFFSHPEQHADEQWLYGQADVDAHLAPYGPASESNAGLWDYLYCLKYLETLLQDPTARNYLRECMSLMRWESLQLRRPFTPDEIGRLLSVQTASYPDTADAFVTKLRQYDDGRSLHAKWLELLGAPDFDLDPPRLSRAVRYVLAKDLLWLCIALQRVCPEVTVEEVSSIFKWTVAGVLCAGLHECGAPYLVPRSEAVIQMTEDVDLLLQEILKLGPSRYSPDPLEDGEAVWHDAYKRPGSFGPDR